MKQLDARGDPIRGHREINEAEASVVRRIFREFAAGVGPRTIARTLNEEGVPGPAGKLWSDTTIRGHVKRGTGLVNNELYIGRLIWNRLRYIKDPSTGKRVSRLNPESEWIIKDVPELRIVDDALWHSVRERQGEIAEKYVNVTEAVRKHHKKNRLNGTRRPKSLLSGLVFCGCCGGPYSLRGADRFACANHISKGACSNSRTIPREELEARVLSGLKDRMMAPEIVGEAMRAYAAETNRLNRERRSSGNAWKAELAKIEKEVRGIIEAIKAGMFHESMKAEMDTLEARKTRSEHPAGRRARGHAGHSAERLGDLCKEGFGPDQAAQSQRRATGSSGDFARPDREDFADTGAGTWRNLRNAARRTGHNPQLDESASHWKCCKNNKTRSGCSGFVVISGCGGVLSSLLAIIVTAPFFAKIAHERR
ncbi:recombinase family protein [Brucella pseudogrignonensis]